MVRRHEHGLRRDAADEPQERAEQREGSGDHEPEAEDVPLPRARTRRAVGPVHEEDQRDVQGRHDRAGKHAARADVVFAGRHAPPAHERPGDERQHRLRKHRE